MAAKKFSRSATYSGAADKVPGEDTVLATRYSSYDDSDIGARTAARVPSLTANVLDTSFLLDTADEDIEKDSVFARRSLSQRISASLNVKLPARLRRNRAHALGRRRTSTRIDDSFITLSKNTPEYVITMDSYDLIERARLRILSGTDSLLIRLLGVLILLAEAAFIIAEVYFIITSQHQRTIDIFQVLDLIFSAYYCVEVSLRIIGNGKVFFRRWFEVLDLVFIVAHTLLTISYIILFHPDPQAIFRTALLIVSGLRLIIFGRVIRVFFWTKVGHEHKFITRYIRSKVSQNKRRYKGEGFDLDLTYVTERVIAMSFPSSGSESFYRNSIRDVGKFLDQKHFGHYKVYNLCCELIGGQLGYITHVIKEYQEHAPGTEREYDTSYFHNQVQRILIDDHNVPKFTDLVDFCEDVYQWLDQDPNHVIVVHCKGGKGRTGMMISAWLVRSGLFEEAGKSLAYFSDRRTDKNLGNKSQGVETPSQSRYVIYYERLLTEMSGNLPPPVPLRITKMTINGLLAVGRGDGADWEFDIYLMNDKIFHFSFIETANPRVQVSCDYETKSVHLIFSEEKPLVVADDVRVIFYCSTKSIPTGNDKCQFNIWFNTTFIDNNRLILDRSELDNLQKSKIQRHYPKDFAVELYFESSREPARTYSLLEAPTEPVD